MKIAASGLTLHGLRRRSPGDGLGQLETLFIALGNEGLMHIVKRSFQHPFGHCLPAELCLDRMAVVRSSSLAAIVFHRKIFSLILEAVTQQPVDTLSHTPRELRENFHSLRTGDGDSVFRSGKTKAVYVGRRLQLIAQRGFHSHIKPVFIAHTSAFLESTGMNAFEVLRIVTVEDKHTPGRRKTIGQSIERSQSSVAS